MRTASPASTATLFCPLSANTLARLTRLYRHRYGLRPYFVTPGGVQIASNDRYGIHNLPALIEIRRNALAEAVRWGEPFVFGTAPGLLNWIIPVVRGETILGGMAGGEVLTGDDRPELAGTAEWLIAAGTRSDRATAYLASVPTWPQARPHEAADNLYHDVYALTGFKPALLDRNRENAVQQRQIAETIHSTKQGNRPATSTWDDERQLLFLLRTGDRTGARRTLNKVLASIFLYAPRPLLIQVRIIELIGYLVRAAVEDDPLLEPLIRQHLAWVERLIAARDFEAVCETTRLILDEFLDRTSPPNTARNNARVQAVLSHLAAHFRRAIPLAELTRLTGLSRFHLSRLVRRTTGRTIPHHIRQLRIREACRLLEATNRSFSDIAYDLGFVDQSYFIKQFREITGTTPKRYRDAGR